MHSIAVALAMSSLLLSQLLQLPAVASAVPHSSCPTKCGDVEIPYPFGIGANCSLGGGFNLTCNTMESGLQKPFYRNVEVRNISLAMGQMRMLNHISSVCHYPNNKSDVRYSDWMLDMEDSPYRLSDLHNKFTVIGCHTRAYILDCYGNNNYRSGCVSLCKDEQSLTNGSCCGINGCCQTCLPKNLKFYKVSFDRDFRDSTDCGIGMCSYAALLEADSFMFHTSYITTNQLMQINNDGRVPVVVDWAIGNETCEVARPNLSSYACISNNSACVDSSNGPGYRCNCSTGYQGNPYVSNGCRDIDECILQPNPCSVGDCLNLPGSYSCHCSDGTTVDGNNGTCTDSTVAKLVTAKHSSTVKVVTGSCSGVILLLLCSTGFCILYRRRKRDVRREYFQQNGGHELEEQMKQEKDPQNFRIFRSQELQKATNRFDDKNIIRRGRNGVVYKGVLENQDAVAIKKPTIIQEDIKRQFGKETLALSHVNHANIIKHLGCCLETETPLLVHEFLPNRTLFHLLHENKNQTPILLDTRLRIAFESADALDYLHTKALPQIIHGDVKSSTILLAADNIAKVLDFEDSKLILNGQKQFAVLLQFSQGYIDPEYLMTYKLTYKSDVYSFGVVLLELFTGKKAIYYQGSEEQRILVQTFAMAENHRRVLDILDNQVKLEASMEFIQGITKLIKQCLKSRGEERPTMKEVAEELYRWRTHMQRHKQRPSVAQRIGEETHKQRPYVGQGIDEETQKQFPSVGQGIDEETQKQFPSVGQGIDEETQKQFPSEGQDIVEEPQILGEFSDASRVDPESAITQLTSWL